MSEPQSLPVLVIQTGQAPIRPRQVQIANAPPIVPLVTPPLHLKYVEMPSGAMFGTVGPVRVVGRSCEDGGMPRAIWPSRATVTPPLFITNYHFQKADVALSAVGPGEDTAQ